MTSTTEKTIPTPNTSLALSNKQCYSITEEMNKNVGRETSVAQTYRQLCKDDCEALTLVKILQVLPPSLKTRQLYTIPGGIENCGALIASTATTKYKRSSIPDRVN